MDEQINRLRSWAEGRARNASVPRDVAQGQHRAPDGIMTRDEMARARSIQMTKPTITLL